MESTGDTVVDFVLGAGPRTLRPDLPARVRETIAKSNAPSIGRFKQACLGLAQKQVAEMHREIAFVSKQNREIESTQEFQARDGIGVPAYRIPISVHFFMESLYGAGCWEDKEFAEDFLKEHPGLRIKVTRGTRGQSYEGTGR